MKQAAHHQSEWLGHGEWPGAGRPGGLRTETLKPDPSLAPCSAWWFLGRGRRWGGQAWEPAEASGGNQGGERKGERGPEAPETEPQSGRRCLIFQAHQLG